jgi:hypothetical protein
MREIIDAANDIFWKQLAWFFYRVKHLQSDSFTPDDDDFRLPAIECDSTISYNSVVPHAEKREFQWTI